MTTVSPPDLLDGRWPIQHCASARCGAPIVWARTEKGSRAPIDARPHPAGTFWLDDRGDGPEPLAVYVPVATVAAAADAGAPMALRQNHFATCPASNSFRRPR